MLQVSVIYNGTGLLLEIIGLIMLLVPNKISLPLKSNVEYQANQFVYPIMGERPVNNDLSNQNLLRMNSLGIIIIVLGLVFQFIAMF
jgi:hypothetical protein